MKKKVIFSLYLVFVINYSFAQILSEVKIGDQVWMSQNLDVDRFRNGDIIIEAKTVEEWIKAGEKKIPAWCYYNNDSNNRFLYGKLYNFYAVIDSRNLAPKGWHMPTKTEWFILGEFVGNGKYFGYEPAERLKSKSGWVRWNGSDSSGFSGFPGGFLNRHGSNFCCVGSGAYWWSRSIENGYVWYAALGWADWNLTKSHISNLMGISVRCVRD
jgi:uncharacterized protein (TIGR02145 family)